MKLKSRTFQIGTFRRPGEGLRLATARFLPRGVKKADYARLNCFDVWVPLPGATKNNRRVGAVATRGAPAAAFSVRAENCK